jgi:hypothetical protein
MNVPDIEDSIERYAVRILFILYFCSDRQTSLPLFNDDYACVIDAESKLQKIDFWLRYPDHLAAALIRGCEPDGNLTLIKRKDKVKQVVRHIFREREPILRWVPMRKYLRGAYEPLDNVMGFLSSRSLAYRRIVERKHRTRYFLTHKGTDAVAKMLKECQETQWYAERCELINSFFGHLNGFEIRKLQYLEGNYATTPYSKMIGHVEVEVRQRFEKLFGEAL